VIRSAAATPTAISKAIVPGSGTAAGAAACGRGITGESIAGEPKIVVPAAPMVRFPLSGRAAGEVTISLPAMTVVSPV
jgi:hypothetical protein